MFANRNRMRRAILLLLGALVISAGTLAVVGVIRARAMRSSCEQLIAALEQGRFEDAYRMTTPSYREDHRMGVFLYSHRGWLKDDPTLEVKPFARGGCVRVRFKTTRHTGWYELYFEKSNGRWYYKGKPHWVQDWL